MVVISKVPGFAHEMYDDDGNAIARALVFRYGSEWFVDSIAVPTELQGNGFGSVMLKSLIRDYGNRRMVIRVDAYGSCRLDNSALESWYSRYGFVRDGEYMARLPTDRSKSCPS